jgi:hypothetical protein
MYSDKLAVAIKNNGKVLREFKDTVYVPFGAEYSFFVKNLNSVRCLVNIEIDGEDIADGNAFVVPANGSIDIERFLKNGNKNAGQRFKFIERTSKIEDHRGIGVEDGLIRVQFEFERPAAPIYPSTYWIKRDYWDGPYYGHGGLGSLSGEVKTSGFSDTTASFSSGSGVRSSSALRSAKLGSAVPKGLADIQCSTASASASSYAAPQNASVVNQVNDAGITVGGSVSDQKFVDAAWFPTDGVKHVMVLKLLGERGQTAVQQPVYARAKQKCGTCGHMNKSHARFCSECGTGLIEP